MYPERTDIFVPGRIEVLGKHTDYAGGRSLVAAVERGFTFAVAPRNDAMVRIVDMRSGEESSFPLSPDVTPTTGHWSNYPMTVARRLARNFPGGLRGADVTFTSDLPPAAGLSSSSALVVGTFLAICAVNRLDEREEYRANIRSKEDLAGYLGTVENGQSFGTLAGDKGVGTFGGSEDHTAILCCEAAKLSQYSYCPVRLERTIAMPAGYVFAVASSGVAAEKTGPAMARYNRASGLTRSIMEHWRAATGRNDAHLAAALASAPDAAERLKRILDGATGPPYSPRKMLDRLEHFIAESSVIVPGAGDALARGDMADLGAIVDRSQELAERLLGNQVPQTIFLARSARSHGAAAASAFGAGFGGSVWAMVEEARGVELLAAWEKAYASAFSAEAKHACFFLTRPGRGVRVGSATAGR